MSDSPALPYDTAAAAAVWRRVAPAIPAYDEAGVPCPAGARCALPRQPGEAGLRQLIDRAAEARLCWRRCARNAPHSVRRTLEGLERGELAALRALLAMHFLLTGQWYQPAPPAAAEGLPAALRALYQAETGLARGCAGAAETLEDECFGQRLSVLSREAAERAKQVGSVVENSLTTGNNLLKW